MAFALMAFPVEAVGDSYVNFWVQLGVLNTFVPSGKCEFDLGVVGHGQVL